MTDTATTPAAPAASAAPAAPAAAPAPAAPAAAPSWLGESTPEDVAGFAQLKGWKSGKDAVDSYRNLEKLLGADRAGRTVTLPGDNAQPAELEAFYGKLGRPAKADDYKITVPEGSSPEFANTAKSWFHEAGLSDKQAAAISTKWNEYAANLMAEQETAGAQQVAVEQQELRKEWGAAYDQNLQVAASVRTKLGITNEEVDSIAEAIGFKRTIAMFHNIGARSGEAEFVSPAPGVHGSGAMTPAAAKARIQQLTSDKEWAKSYIAGDAGKREEMRRLNQLASGQTPR